MMPVMDGFSFVNELRRDEERSDIPVVVVTAKDLTTEDRGRLKDVVATIEAKDSDFKVQLLAYVRDRMQPSTAA